VARGRPAPGLQDVLYFFKEITGQAGFKLLISSQKKGGPFFNERRKTVLKAQWHDGKVEVHEGSSSTVIGSWSGSTKHRIIRSGNI
jgi:hypothetical protein